MEKERKKKKLTPQVITLKFVSYYFQASKSWEVIFMHWEHSD